MIDRPPVVFPDVEQWAVGYLRTFLDDRTEDFAHDVDVDVKTPELIPARLVTVRDDGGQRRPGVTKTASLGINVWAERRKDASDLARLVAAALEASAGHGPVVAHLATSGPYPVGEESEKPRRYVSVDLIVRGSAL